MGRWDQTIPDGTYPMHAVIDPPMPPGPEIGDGESPSNKLGAFLFVLWSAFMMCIGFMIGMVVSGHIIIR